MEIWYALNSMANNKSPGNDGLSKEFYVCFFQEIRSCLLDVLNLSFTHGQLSNSQRQAMITLIEKKGKDKRFLKNWRPISLINVDANVASKSSALRVRKVLNTLIHSDQTAYLKDRYIGESVRLISDLLEYTDDNDTEAILFSADFEKAFDSIDHCFLFSVLKSFGFGPDFIQWVRTLFKNSESCVMNNGFSTGYFALERGTRHGDPLLAYLFILALEVMFIEVRINFNIAGVKIGDHSVKLSAYADDTYFFTLDVNSLRLLLKTCDKFEEYSSLRLSVEKCQACMIGCANGTQDAPINCNWVNLVDDKVLTPGVHVSYDAEKCNFLHLSTSIKKVLRIWGSTGLTLAGRIKIFKSAALPKMVYISTMLYPSKQTLDQLNLMQKDFIWRAHRPKIKHSTLIGDYTNGGYKDVDIESKFESLKIIWIRRLLDSNFHSWKVMPQCLLSEIGIQSLFHSNFKPSEIWQLKIASFPKFYQGLIYFWETAITKEPSNLREITSQTVWNNYYISKQGNTLSTIVL